MRDGEHRGASMGDNFDVLGELVPEVSIKILRMLDMKSLATAGKVCKRWRSLCYNDATLKRRMQRFRELQLLKKKLRRIKRKLVCLKNELVAVGRHHGYKITALMDS